jgi:hypothetical protein
MKVQSSDGFGDPEGSRVAAPGPSLILAVALPSLPAPIRPSYAPVNGEWSPPRPGALHRPCADRGARSHHRLRAIHLKQWKRGTTIFRELRARGLPEPAARKVASNGRRWWKNSAKLINVAFPISYFDQLGIPRLAS